MELCAYMRRIGNFSPVYCNVIVVVRAYPRMIDHSQFWLPYSQVVHAIQLARSFRVYHKDKLLKGDKVRNGLVDATPH